MKNEKEIKAEMERRKKIFFDSVFTTTNLHTISFSRQKDIINALRWVLEEVKTIEVAYRGTGRLSGLSK